MLTSYCCSVGVQNVVLTVVGNRKTGPCKNGEIGSFWNASNRALQMLRTASHETFIFSMVVEKGFIPLNTFGVRMLESHNGCCRCRLNCYSQH